MDRTAIYQQRTAPVTKHNDVIQKAKYSLTATEQRALAFIISKVRMSDTELKPVVFNIRDYCEVVGINPDTNDNRTEIKRSIDRLGIARFWFLEGTKEYRRFWLEPTSILIDWKAGTIRVCLSDWLSEYLLGLKRNYTQYYLESILPMQSEYSIRIFEICKSHLHQGKFGIRIDQLKQQIVKEGKGIEDFYPRFPDFRRFVLDQAQKEINAYSEIYIEWEPVKLGNKTVSIIFTVRPNDSMQRYRNVIGWADKADGTNNMELVNALLPQAQDEMKSE